MKTGLALCGGGALGSYELGAWKYMRELGMSFDVVTGTSIGAVNGAFVIADAFEELEKVWSEIEIDKVIDGGSDLDVETLRRIYSDGSAATKLVRSYIKNKGIDVSPYYELAKSRIVPLHPEKSEKPFGVIVCQYSPVKEMKVRVNGLSSESMIDALLGSSAAWPVFPIYVSHTGKKYIDGGWRNNLPIDYALELGADRVIAVSLNPIPAPQKAEFEKLPNVTLIKPSMKIGSMFNFSQDVIEQNKELGYLDAKKAFGNLRGTRYFFSKDGFEGSAYPFMKKVLDPKLSGWAKFKTLCGSKSRDPVDAYLAYAEKILPLFGIVDKLQEYSFEKLCGTLREAMLSYEPDRKDLKNELRCYLIRVLKGDSPKKKLGADFEIGRFFVEATFRSE
ncbi:MAG: patatin-like phospholipase family protein [Bacilli bacterium]|nr:patatin-like phospholipase family protein [Bacilli bacterium]